MDSEHIFIGYSIGAIDYILKPFDPVILKAKVQGFVEIYKMNQKLIYQRFAGSLGWRPAAPGDCGKADGQCSQGRPCRPNRGR